LEEHKLCDIPSKKKRPPEAIPVIKHLCHNNNNNNNNNNKRKRDEDSVILIDSEPSYVFSTERFDFSRAALLYPEYYGLFNVNHWEQSVHVSIRQLSPAALNYLFPKASM